MNPPQGSLIWWAAVVVIAIGGLWLLGVALNIFGTIFTWVEWTFSPWERDLDKAERRERRAQREREKSGH